MISEKAIPTPALLVWARKNIGLSIEETAKKVQIKPERLAKWETGELQPTIKQLRKLAKVYKRPLAVFFLSRPPKDFQALKDFRRLPDIEFYGESPDLRFEIRQARYRRDVAINLFNDLGETPPKFEFSVNLDAPPEKVAEELRESLDIRYEEQIKWKDHYEALKRWRSALERVGVLVFQATNIDVNEMRGFSIAKYPLPVIVMNIKDSPRGRIFSMLHEFTHVALRIEGICNFSEAKNDRSFQARRIEVFANAVAGAVLVPMRKLIDEEIVIAKGKDIFWTDEELKFLAKKYSVSSEVILRRLLFVGKTTKKFYGEKRDEFEEKYLQLRKKKSKGYPSQYQVAVSRSGILFSNLVLESYNREIITSSKLSDYFGVRLKHIPKIESYLDQQFAEGYYAL